jgi:Ca2+-binding EF-hand superfamily protein
MQISRMQFGDDAPEERLKELTEIHWQEANEDDDATVDFTEFVRWFSSNGFNEDLFLTDEQRHIRNIARDLGLNAGYVEALRQKFEEYVVDDEVSYPAFKKIIYKGMRIPDDAELPESRLKFFWQELDADGSGTATFEEFLVWWTKYFNPSRSNATPGVDFFLGFYRGIRSLKHAKMDPPAYKALNLRQSRVMQELGM